MGGKALEHLSLLLAGDDRKASYLTSRIWPHGTLQVMKGRCGKRNEAPGEKGERAGLQEEGTDNRRGQQTRRLGIRASKRRRGKLE